MDAEPAVAVENGVDAAVGQAQESKSPQRSPGKQSSSQSKPVSGLKKAAILLVFLGEKASTEIFRNLRDDEVKLLSQAITDLGLVGEAETENVLNQCYTEMMDGKVKLRGDLDYVRKVISNAYTDDEANDIMRYLSGKDITADESVRALKYADPQLLAKLIQDEHPQTIAVVAAHLEPKHAASVLRMLPEEMRCDIAVRLAQLDQISQPVRNKVTEIIAAKLREGGQYTEGSRGGLKTVAEIFNRMDRNMSGETLEAIEKDNPNLALSIRNLMFVFDDILLLSDTDMRKVIQKVDKKVLVQALKGTSEELREHFYRNMSQRAVEMLQEDMEAIGPVRLTDAEAARQEVVGVVRALETEGLVDIRGSAGDQYVV
jgi:flagellar motor switch protein FliG